MVLTSFAATIKYASGLCAAYATLPTVASCNNGTASATSSSNSTVASTATTAGTSATTSAKTSGTAAAAASGAAYNEKAGMGLGLAAAGLLAAVL